MNGLPALGVLEVQTIARGLVVADALVKRAMVRLLRAIPVTPGKYVIVFAGGEAEVQESMRAGREMAGAQELDTLELPQAHPAIVPALDSVEPPPITGAIGVLEMATVAATLLACDTALKHAETTLCALHLARGIGGKGYFVLTGELHSVEASLDAGDAIVLPPLRIARELIARPHPDLLSWLGTGSLGGAT